MTLNSTRQPKLRSIDVRPFYQNGKPCFLLRDPLQLTEQAVIIPQPLGAVLALCDGTRDSKALSISLGIRYGLRVGPEVIEQLITAFDEALLLDNERFARALEQALNEYRQAPFRPPSSAGRSYPNDADDLRSMLRSYLDDVDERGGEMDGGDVRGFVSPHIDYVRGGPVYAQVWKRAEPALRAADLVVLLGTDHQGEYGVFNLTRQHYATPFGVLPVARDVMDRLAHAVGQEAAFANELYHRVEHSIELAAVWLHYIRQERACEIVPVLCGSFGHFVNGEGEPSADPTVNALVDTLRQELEGRQALVVAAADLAHVGPAFGGRQLDFAGRARVKAVDDELVEQMCAGDAEGFFAKIKRDGDRYNVCGLSPIYLALRVLGPTHGERAAYDCCPADEHGTSIVSICGILFD
jgi:AmmeMemoRadiSam system protein B